MTVCGIVGAFGSLQNLNLASIRNHISSLNYRGPDGDGFVQGENWFLGHTRLSIQDLSDCAKQPFFSKSGKSAISFNGELYNKEELALSLGDFEFRTSSDTEVLVELIESRGIQSIELIRGMFAFAFLDLSAKESYLARDIYGEKPLYYASDARCVVFSSSPSIHHSLVSRSTHRDPAEIDDKALCHFIKYGYFPIDRFLIPGVKSVLPGEIVKIKLNNADVEKYRYKYDSKVSDKDLQTSISESVRESLISDVPVGVMLSGGLDSSIILYESIKHQPSIKAFTLELSNSSNDAFFAEKICKHLGIADNLTQLSVESSEVANLIFGALSNAPFPLGDSALISVYALTSKANSEVKVLLSGDGSDELFGGYEYYNKYLLKPKFLIESIIQIMSKIIPLEERIKQILKLIPSSLSKKKHRELWNKELSAVDSESLLELLDSCKSVKKVISNNPNFENIADVLSWDLDSYLPGNLLAKSDIGGMLNSVEIRSPFLNPRILKFIDKEKSRPNLFGKLELKTAYQDIIPFDILSRKKRGFGLPIVKWFRYEGVQDLVNNYIESGDKKIFTFVNHDSVMKQIEQNSYLKWHMLCLSIWIEENL